MSKRYAGIARRPSSCLDGEHSKLIHRLKSSIAKLTSRRGYAKRRKPELRITVPGVIARRRDAKAETRVVSAQTGTVTHRHRSNELLKRFSGALKKAGYGRRITPACLRRSSFLIARENKPGYTEK